MSKKNPGLIRNTLSFLRLHWRILTAVVGVITIVTNILTILGGGQETATAYISIVTLFMNVALIWTIIRLHNGKDVTFARAYYDGTGSVVRFFLVAVILALQTIPAAIGLAIYYFGTTSPSGTIGVTEALLLGAVALLLALPTVFLLSRSVFSLYAVVGDGLKPMAALRVSKKIARGHFMQILRRLVLLLVILLILVIVPSLVVAFIGGAVANKWVMAVLQSLLVTVMLPFMNVYLYKLYLQLVGEKSTDDK